MSSSINSVGEARILSGCVDTSALRLAWSEAPWDTLLFNFPVLQINTISVHGLGAGNDFVEFDRARDEVGCKFVSCRLGHEQLRESMLLEGAGFRFIEMLYQPEYAELESYNSLHDTGLTISLAKQKDLPEIIEIAGMAFHNERFHIDHRLPYGLGDQRYKNWIKNCFSHATQRLYAIQENEKLIAFFVTENLEDGTCYWHLNAVAPKVQGRGYGRRAWEAMMTHARKEGAKRVRTSIVARNYRVLNLYARLGFNFSSPLMTFHWVSS